MADAAKKLKPMNRILELSIAHLHRSRSRRRHGIQLEQRFAAVAGSKKAAAAFVE